MEKLIVEARQIYYDPVENTYSPYIYFEPDTGILIIEGRCTIDYSFFEPVNERLVEYNSKMPEKILHAFFNIHDFSSNGFKGIIKILRLIQCREQIYVYWNFIEEEDEDYETGLDISDVFYFPIILWSENKLFNNTDIKKHVDFPGLFLSENNKKIIRKNIKDTLFIDFDMSIGCFKVSGKSTIESDRGYFQKLLNIIDYYIINNKEKHYEITFQIDSCDMQLQEYFLKFLHAFNDCKDIDAKWKYNTGNYEILEIGQHFIKELNYKLHLVEIEA
jgi:hypothetical protein